MPFVWVPKFQSFNYSTDTPSPSAISFWNQTLAISHNVTLAKLAMPLFFRLMSVAGRRNPATNWRQWISIASLINEKSEDLKMIHTSFKMHFKKLQVISYLSIGRCQCYQATADSLSRPTECSPRGFLPITSDQGTAGEKEGWRQTLPWQPKQSNMEVVVHHYFSSLCEANECI